MNLSPPAGATALIVTNSVSWPFPTLTRVPAGKLAGVVRVVAPSSALTVSSVAPFGYAFTASPG